MFLTPKTNELNDRFECVQNKTVCNLDNVSPQEDKSATLKNVYLNACKTKPCAILTMFLPTRIKVQDSKRLVLMRMNMVQGLMSVPQRQIKKYRLSLFCCCCACRKPPMFFFCSVNFCCSFFTFAFCCCFTFRTIKFFWTFTVWTTDYWFVFTFRITDFWFTSTVCNTWKKRYRFFTSNIFKLFFCELTSWCF